MTPIKLIRAEVQRAVDKLQTTVRRSILRNSPDDYFLQAEGHDAAEQFDDVEHWQAVGITSRPLAGSEVLIVKVGGKGEGAVAIASQDRAKRPTGLAEGDTWLYASAADQALLKLLADGNILILPGDTGDTCDIGPGPTDFMLLGTTFDTANRILIAALNTWALAMFTGWTAAGVGFTAAGTGFTALSNDGVLDSATKTACGVAAAAMGVASTACGVAAAASNPAMTGAITTFLASTYLAVWGKVK